MINASKKKKMMRVGVIVRDQKGRALASMCSLKLFIVDSTVAEAYAAIQQRFRAI